MLQYIRPYWSSKPIHPYQIEIIKEGIIVQEATDICEKQYYLVGKIEDQLTDFVLKHESVSRRHAVIQHKDTGAIFIYDLGSTHGTFVNKKIIPEREYVELKVGDCIRFGFSSRVFILHGPEQDEEKKEEEKPKKKQLVSKKEHRQKLLKHRISQVQKIHEEREKQQIKYSHDEGGISWGMDFEEPEEIKSESDEFEEEWITTLDFTELKKRENLKQKHLDAIGRLEEQVKKLNRVDAEIMKHSKRDSTELEMTENKAKKVGILQIRASQLKKKIDLGVDNLKSALKQLSQEQKRKARGIDEYYRNDSDDDQFYDRTKGNKIKQQIKALNQQSSVLTYDTLKTQLETNLRERDKLVKELTHEDRSQAAQDIEEIEDQLDQFMKENQQGMWKENREKLRLRLKEVQAQIDHTQNLLRVATPGFMQASQHKANKIEISEVFQRQNPQTKKEVRKEEGSLTETLKKLQELSQKKRQEDQEKEANFTKLKELSRDANKPTAQPSSQLLEHLEQGKKLNIDPEEPLQSEEEEDIQELDQEEQIQRERIQKYLNLMVTEDQKREVKTAFDEIIKNKNQDNIDLNQYKLFLQQYKGEAKKKEEPQIQKRKKVMKAEQKPKSRNLNEEDERQADKEEVGYDEWLPSDKFKRSMI